MILSDGLKFDRDTGSVSLKFVPNRIWFGDNSVGERGAFLNKVKDLAISGFKLVVIGLKFAAINFFIALTFASAVPLDWG
jgi:hypothetical protein